MVSFRHHGEASLPVAGPYSARTAVRDLVPAAAPLERYGNPAGYLILAYMFVQCPAEHAEIAYVFARRQLVRWRIF
jgi:hypothetical protein